MLSCSRAPPVIRPRQQQHECSRNGIDAMLPSAFQHFTPSGGVPIARPATVVAGAAVVVVAIVVGAACALTARVVVVVSAGDGTSVGRGSAVIVVKSDPMINTRLSWVSDLSLVILAPDVRCRSSTSAARTAPGP